MLARGGPRVELIVPMSIWTFARERSTSTLLVSWVARNTDVGVMRNPTLEAKLQDLLYRACLAAGTETSIVAGPSCWVVRLLCLYKGKAETSSPRNQPLE